MMANVYGEQESVAVTTGLLPVTVSTRRPSPNRQFREQERVELRTRLRVCSERR
jgi:hypothetical protein